MSRKKEGTIHEPITTMEAPTRKGRNMRRMKLAITLVVLALVAAACSSGTAETTTTQAPSGGEDTTTTTAAPGGGDDTTTTAAMAELEGVEIKLWGWSSSDAENEALSDIVEAFNAETGAAAEFQPQADYDATLTAALAAGDPPDVFYVDSFNLASLADEGVLAPVPGGALSDPDDFYESLTAAFTWDGTWYCPPKDFSTLALVYDPGMLEAAGVEVPTTWDELAAAAATLTTGDLDAIIAGTASAGLTMGVEYPRWGTFLFQNGSALTDEAVSEITLDTPEAREALQFVADLYTSGAAISPAAADAGWAGEAFGQGKAAMAIEGNWIVGYLNDTFPDKDFAVAELAVGPVGPGTFAFTVCYGVANSAANPEASWELIEYLTNASGALAWTNAFNVMPARLSVSAEWLSDKAALEPFVAGAEYASRWGFRAGVNDIVGVFNENAEKLITGDITVDEFVEQVTDDGNGILN